MKQYLLSFALLIGFSAVNAQSTDDLLSQLEGSEPTSERVRATFKTTRVILSHSNETVGKGGLDFRVTHRFGEVGGATGGIKTFYGFDNSADIRTAFEYGLTDRATIGYGRSKMGQSFDVHAKYRALWQTTDNKMPISLTMFLSGSAITQKAAGTEYDNMAHRFSYIYQAIIGRKFSNSLSMEVLPTYFHRNYVADPKDANDLFALGIAGRLKLTQRFGIVADYYFIHSAYRNSISSYQAPLGLGIEIETGGHVFSINFTNSAGITEQNFLANTQSNWLKGQFRFGFNISRVFYLTRPDKDNRSIIK